MANPLGSIFAEEIILGQKRKSPAGNWGDREKDSSPARLFFLVVIFVFGLGLLLARLFSVMIIRGDKYRKLSLGNRTREATVLAPRGIIYDRNGIALVRNIPVFQTPGGQVFFENVPATAAGNIKDSTSRDYIYKEDTAHVLGYVGEISGEELKNQKAAGKSPQLEPGDAMGKMGIEKYYDDILRGQNGKELIEVDAVGKEVRKLGRLDPVPGKSITLTIDSRLQKIAGEELGGKKGALIAQNPKTGEVYALYSSPSFDPNRLIRNTQVEKLLADPDNPFFDRAIAGLYPPGSTFKIVLAVSALESGAINRDTKIEDTGIINVGPFSFSNWYFTQYGKKEGMVDIVSAIKRSNDIFFYKAGEATGIETIAKWGKLMGLGNTLGIDLPGEEGGTMPDPVWRQKARGEGWFLGDTYHVSIGQGDLQVTPLQVNNWANVIANDGKLCRPHLSSLANLSNLPARIAAQSVAGGCKDAGIKAETISLVKEGMKEACSPALAQNGPGGTGWPLFNFKVPVACKTGTAEFGDRENRTHAWFTVFAPIENPQISVTVLVEGGGEGSNTAAPIAKKILEKWFGS